MGKNVKAMNACVNETVALVSEKHSVKKLDAGEFADMKAKGMMKFHVDQYDVEGAVNLSIMTMNMGLMQMASLVFAPYGKDLPLLSLDYMFILGNRKAYLENYDLVEVKTPEYEEGLKKFQENFKKYSSLQDITATKAWYEHLLTATCYKTGKAKEDETLKALLLDTVKVYLDQMDSLPPLSKETQTKKNALVKDYSDRLISEGGISTDFFKKNFGPDFTRKFFDNVFFGTGLHK